MRLLGARTRRGAWRSRDSPTGMAAAVAAGAPSVGVTTSQSPAALFGAGASLCVADFADARLGEGARVIETCVTRGARGGVSHTGTNRAFRVGHCRSQNGTWFGRIAESLRARLRGCHDLQCVHVVRFFGMRRRKTSSDRRHSSAHPERAFRSRLVADRHAGARRLRRRHRAVRASAPRRRRLILDRLGRLPAGASPHVACVTSLSPRRDRSASAHVVEPGRSRARRDTRGRAGVVLAASRAAFRAFAAGASADSGAPDARSATNESQISPATTMTSRTTPWWCGSGTTCVWRITTSSSVPRRSRAADPGVEVLPVYCFDPRCFERSAWGSPKTGAHRARFLRECVADLQSNLRLIGSDLLVVVGKPEEVIAPLVLGDGKTTVVLTQVRSRYSIRIRAGEKRFSFTRFRFCFLRFLCRASPVRMII